MTSKQPANSKRAPLPMTMAFTEDPELLERTQVQREALVPHVSWEEAIKSYDMGIQWLAMCSW